MPKRVFKARCKIIGVSSHAGGGEHSIAKIIFLCRMS